MKILTSFFANMIRRILPRPEFIQDREISHYLFHIRQTIVNRQYQYSGVSVSV